MTHGNRVAWLIALALAGVDIAVTIVVARIKVRGGEPLITASAAFLSGIQTLVTILLGALTATYVITTNSLLREATLERAEREQQRRSDALGRQQADLDETRRLAYVALVARKTEHVELAATLVNALVHHQNVTLDEALAHVPTVLNGGDGDYPSAAWIKAQIETINTNLAALEANEAHKQGM
jgi:hypothetical protein